MQYACIALLGSSEAELEDKRDHYYPAYDRVGKRESEDRSGRIPLKSGGLDSMITELDNQYDTYKVFNLWILLIALCSEVTKCRVFVSFL